MRKDEAIQSNGLFFGESAVKNQLRPAMSIFTNQQKIPYLRCSSRVEILPKCSTITYWRGFRSGENYAASAFLLPIVEDNCTPREKVFFNAIKPKETNMTQWRYLPIVVATACLTACSGKGVDASLNLSSQEQYNQSYLVAAKDMTDEQKKAYEWAVSTLSLPQAAAKWKSPTPRQIITDESNAYIKAHTDLIAKETQKMAQRKDELEANEALIVNNNLKLTR